MKDKNKILEVYQYKKHRFEICRSPSGKYILFVSNGQSRAKLAEGNNPQTLERKAEAYADKKEGDEKSAAK